jgi:putative membrane protein
MTRTVLSLIAIPALVCAVGAGATAATKKSDADTTSPAAHGFLQKAAVGGMAEVELGKLAQQNASNAAVKEFATQMVTDHGKANQELESLAQKDNVTLPTQLDAKHTALRDRLAKLSGAAFDRAYMTEMVKDHEKDVAEFRAESKSAANPDVKAFATRTLPVLEGHLKMAQDVQKKL